MQREIKFRIWDTNMNCMYSMKQLLLRWNTLSVLTCPYFKIMQYTGLNDKNGIEIYEGDIVLLNNMEKAIVEYRTDICGFTVCDITKSYVSTFMDLKLCKANLTVIGNIYTNPNLLDQEDNQDGERV